MTSSQTEKAESFSIPPPEKVEVFLDFDGTITQSDILDELVARYAVDDSWKELERKWQAGRIGSRECLSKEFDLVAITRAELNAFLETIALDPGVEGFFQCLAENRIPVTIVSDGVDQFIRKVLKRLDRRIIPRGLTVRANAIEHARGRLKLVMPHGDAACETAAAHCKCRSAGQRHRSGRLAIYVGDGLSDLCPARRADLVFAKGRLAEALERESIPFIPFNTLVDVTDALVTAWMAQARVAD